ncbi:hypothetical protein [Methylobacterium sp. CM6244]
MFTDQPVTPARLEAVIDLVRHMGDRKVTLEVLDRLVQPRSLPGVTPSSRQGRVAINAARSLGLLVDDKEGGLRLDVPSRDRRPVHDLLLDTLDTKVLTNLDLEPYLALFYSYLITRGGEAKSGGGAFWEAEFGRDVFGGENIPDRFNATKYTGLRRWLRYLGLGWHDSQDSFQPNPYERLRRRLPAIFGAGAGERRFRVVRLDAAAFMARLAQECPELDGGWIFLRAANGRSVGEQRCTSALAHALVDLHLDGVIQLDCPADTPGWSLSHAQPPRDGDRLRSDRFHAIEWPGPQADQENRDAA